MYKRLAPRQKALAWQTWSGRRVQTNTVVDLRAALLVGRAQPSPRPRRVSLAGAMLSLYREIFLDHGNEVAGLGDAPVILDCGGNIGMSVIWFKQRYPRARIIAGKLAKS